MNLPNINDGTIFYDLEIDSNYGIYLTTEGLYGYTGQCFKFNGSTWNEIITNNSTVNPQRIKFTKPHNGLIFALVDVSDARKLFKTTNYGANWSIYKESVSVRDPKCEIEYSPNSDYIYIGDLGMNVVDHSTGNVIDMPYHDSENNSHHFDIRDIVITGETGDYENILFANDGGLSRMQINKYSLEDYSFTNLNGDHLPVNNFVGLGVGQSNNDFILAGATHGHVLAKTNNNMTFYYGGDGDDAAINPKNATDYYSSNGGVTSSINGRFYNGAKWFIGMPMELHPFDNKQFLTCPPKFF